MTSEDENWDAVSRFMSDLRNASRLATYVDTVVEMYESGAWREYTDATGREDSWREREFDYFLIACGADYTDVQRLLAWEKAKAVDLAAAMDTNDEHPEQRRALDAAASDWASPAGVPLNALAEQQGWMRPGGTMKPAPLPARARTRARTGASKDTNARERRAEAIEAVRRAALDGLVDELLDEVTDVQERRYLADVLSARLRGGG